MEIGPKLVATLIAADDRSIPYGVIVGEAQPLKRNDVIRSPHVKNVTSLMQNVKIREHKSEWSKTTRLW